MSYRIIKKQSINNQMDDFKIPIIPAEGLENVKQDKHINKAEKETMERSARLINEAEIKAKSIIEKANLESKTIKVSAEQKGYKDGYKKGLDAGYSEGYIKINKETKETRENAKELLKNAHKKTREYIRSMDEEILHFSAAIAKNIIHYSIDTRDENIIEMIKSALKLAEERRQIIIRCNPASNLVLQANLYQFKKICPNANFTFLEDREVNKYGCIIDTEEQVIDLDITKQLEAMVSSLLEKREENEL